MHKVMVVDDDYPVLAFVADAVPWAELGLTLQSTHEDGEQALEAALAAMPDILLTDIGMPRMDGLELIRRLKERKPNLRVAILSCHSEFHYAQQAMKLNVQDYLVKDTLEPDDLRQLLQRLKASLDEERSESSERTRLRRLADRSRERLKEAFVRQTIDQPIWSESDWYAEAASHGLEAEGRHLLPVLATADDYPDALRRFRSDDMLRFAADNVLAEATRALDAPVVHFGYGAARTFLLFAYRPSLKTNRYDEAADATRRIQEALRQSLKLSCTCLIGDLCRRPAELKQQLDELLRSEAQRFYLPEGAVAKRQPFVPDAADLFERYDEAISEFRERIVARDADGAAAVVDRWTDWIAAHPQPPEIVKDWVIKIWLDLKLKLQSLTYFHLPVRAEALHRDVSRLASLAELRRWLLAQTEAVWAADGGIGLASGRAEVMQAYRYVVDHLDRRIGLEEMAERLHLNASYFSRLFKRELGETFTEFVTRLKMTRAKELLDRTGHSVGRIGELLGYDNQSYFIKTFKAHTGVTPAEYRSKGAGG